MGRAERDGGKEMKRSFDINHRQLLMKIKSVLNLRDFDRETACVSVSVCVNVNMRVFERDCDV